MKLYKIANALPGERWHSAKTGLTGFEEVELTKDGRAGMAQFLNANELDLIGVGLLPPTPLDPLEAAELRAVAAAKGGTTQLTADTIIAFILDDATVAQAEAVFAALGTRFKEHVNGAR
jgi:hypothetical protein